MTTHKDKTFKELMQDTSFIRSLIKNNLPREVADKVDWSTFSTTGYCPKTNNKIKNNDNT